MTSGAYVLTDNNGATGTVNITVVANRWDVTNIDAGTNTDTISNNQLVNVLQGTPGTAGPVMGDNVVLRTGAVIDPPQFDTIQAAAGQTTGTAAPGDIRIKRPTYQALKDRISGADGQGGPYTALTLPDASWIKITADTAKGATIRHLQINGTNQDEQGLWFDNLNFQWDYGTNGSVGGWPQGTAILAIGSGATVQSYVKVKNSTFKSNAPNVIGQRGTTGVFSVSVNDNGTSGCTTASLTISDNHGGPAHGTGAAYHATISGGVITAWVRDSAGANYDTNGITGGTVPSGQGTWANVISDCTGSTPTATPNGTNSLNVPTGILGAGSTSLQAVGNRELVIQDNTFTDMWDGVNLTGNQANVNYSTPSNIWIVGNEFVRPWTAAIQTANAAPVYTEWNYAHDVKYASGYFHPDFEIRLYAQTMTSTYPYGDDIGNIYIRGSGQDTWGDGQGIFMSNPGNGHGAGNNTTPTFSGCKMQGNIYVGTYTNALNPANCDSTANISFNTVVWDPAVGIVNLNQNGAAQSSNAGTINKGSGSVSSFGGTSSYNAISGTPGVWTGGTETNNVKSLGLGTSVASAAAYAAPPANAAGFAALSTINDVVTAFTFKVGGTLDHNVTGFPYNVGTGGYFNYSTRTASPPF